MKLSEDEAKRFLERLCPLQETEQQLLCPRCGRNELYSGLYFFLNSLSRYAHVYICEKCWMDEALREIDGNPVPPVSYTHLDVYKRQILLLLNLFIQCELFNNIYSG